MCYKKKKDDPSHIMRYSKYGCMAPTCQKPICQGQDSCWDEYCKRNHKI